MVGCMKRWLSKRRKNNAKKIVKICETMVDRSFFISFMMLWKSKVTYRQISFMQHWIRKSLRVRKTLYENLLDMWTITERLLYSKINLTKSKKKHMMSSSLLKISLVPERLKLNLIQNSLKEITREHSNNMKNYKAQLQLHEESIANFAWCGGGLTEIKPKKPPPLNIKEYFLKFNILDDLINQALRKRSIFRTSIIN